MAADLRLKSRCLSLIRRGLLSMTGAAYVCDVSRQAVAKWCDEAGIDAKAAEMRRWMALKDRRRGRGQRKRSQ